MRTSKGNFKTTAGYFSSRAITDAPNDASFTRTFYQMLAAYYQNNGLYDLLRSNTSAVMSRQTVIESLRNPANRVVEFYASKMWPGSLPDAIPIITDNANIIEPIQQFWKWSNFSSKKQQFVRWFSIYGDTFIKVNANGDSVYMSLLKPENVSEIKLDHRGFLTYIRIDVPISDSEFYVEVWDKDTQIVRTWTHTLGLDIELDRLGKPDVKMSFARSHGENFIPIVYQPFKEDGMGRCNGAFTHVLDKIDHVNGQATQLSAMLFRHNKPVWALIGGVDEAKRAMPAPALETGANGRFSMNDEVIGLPGGTKLEPLVPNINYGDALAILQDDMAELENDLPELAYYHLRELNISGRAALTMLDDAYSKLDEARGNADTALARANEMALTIGMNIGVWGNLGTYEAGDFDHSFGRKDFLPELANDVTATSTVASATPSLETSATI